MSVTSDLLALLSRAPVRIGAASLDGIENPAAACHTIPVVLDWRATPHVHQSERNLEILRPVGCSTTDTSHEVGVTPGEREEAELLLRQFRSSARRIIGFHPGAGKPGNRWPSERFAGIMNRFCLEQDAVAIMTIGPMDDSVRDAVVPLVSVPLKTLQGLSIRSIAAAIACMDLFLTNDTGIMHVAAGVGVPTLALFGPTDPLQWAPRSPRVHVIQSTTGNIEDIGTDQVYDMLNMMISRG
jgi:ADP-heptose:LPS heptosyltransferase